MCNEQRAQTITESDKLAVAVHLEDFKSCRNEIQETIKFVFQMQLFELAFAGVLVSFLSHINSDQSLTLYALYYYALAIPIPFYIFSIINYHHHRRIVRAARYIELHVAKDVRRITGTDSVLSWERNVKILNNEENIFHKVLLHQATDILLHIIVPPAILGIIVHLRGVQSFTDIIFIVINIILFFVSLYLFLNVNGLYNWSQKNTSKLLTSRLGAVSTKTVSMLFRLRPGK